MLCVFGTYWSNAFIVLVQLSYIIAPRIPHRSPSCSSAVRSWASRRYCERVALPSMTVLHPPLGVATSDLNVYEVGETRVTV